MGEYQLVPDISMNNAPVFRSQSGCLYYNDEGNWAVNKQTIDPYSADIVNDKEDQNKDKPLTSGWKADLAITATF